MQILLRYTDPSRRDHMENRMPPRGGGGGGEVQQVRALQPTARVDVMGFHPSLKPRDLFVARLVLGTLSSTSTYLFPHTGLDLADMDTTMVEET